MSKLCWTWYSRDRPDSVIDGVMEAIEQLKDDLRAGRIDANRLIDLIVVSQQQLQASQQQLQASQQRIAELEKQLLGSGTAKVDEP